MLQLKERYHLLDALRGFSMISMICYHGCYDLRYVFGLPLSFLETRGAFWWQQSICWAFLLLSGASVRLSSRPAKRGAVVLGCGLLLTAVTFLMMPSQRIVFGVLHLLGSAMLLTALLSRLLCAIPSLVGAAGSFWLFLATRWLSRGLLFGVAVFDSRRVKTNLFAPLGVFGSSFFSADYFPIVPWYFLFLTGYFLFGLLRERGWDRLLLCRAPLLSVVGRRTLPIYLLHQPVLMAIGWLVWRMW